MTLAVLKFHWKTNSRFICVTVDKFLSHGCHHLRVKLHLQEDYDISKTMARETRVLKPDHKAIEVQLWRSSEIKDFKDVQTNQWQTSQCYLELTKSYKVHMFFRQGNPLFLLAANMNLWNYSINKVHKDQFTIVTRSWNSGFKHKLFTRAKTWDQESNSFVPSNNFDIFSDQFCFSFSVNYWETTETYQLSQKL